MSQLFKGFVFAAIAVLSVCFYAEPARAFGKKQPELQTVPFVDVQRYMGVWYEIARIDQTFEKGCTGVTAEYALQDDGSVSVKNTCHQDRLEGPIKVANGNAKVVDTATNAKLKVTFFWPFCGDYWIVELGENYDYAVVGSPDRDYLWILSRTPRMDPKLYDAIIERRAAQGFPVELVKPTVQDWGPLPHHEDWGGV